MIRSREAEHGGGEPMMVPAFQPVTLLEEPAEPVADSADRFRALVRDQFDFIWRSLRGLGVPASAVDDAAQHVFLVASQKLDSIAVGSERSFLFGTAMGVAANVRRARSRVREVSNDEALAVHTDQDALDPEQIAAKRQARRLLDEVLAKMSDDLRVAFVLFELEGLTTAEIASVLELPTGTVASRLRRARDEFSAIARRVQAAASRGGGR